MAADLCMGTADDRVGDDHICLRTLTNDQLRIVHNCKALARVHLDQSSNYSRGRRDAAGHRGSIIIINQTSRRIPVFVIVIPVGITLCILLGMNCIADDYRGNGQDGAITKSAIKTAVIAGTTRLPVKRFAPFSLNLFLNTRKNTASSSSTPTRFVVSVTHLMVYTPVIAATMIKTKKYDQKDPSRQRFYGFCANNIFNCQQLCIQQTRIRKIGKHARLPFSKKLFSFPEILLFPS